MTEKQSCKPAGGRKSDIVIGLGLLLGLGAQTTVTGSQLLSLAYPAGSSTLTTMIMILLTPVSQAPLPLLMGATPSPASRPVRGR